MLAQKRLNGSLYFLLIISCCCSINLTQSILYNIVMLVDIVFMLYCYIVCQFRTWIAVKNTLF